MDKCKKCTYYDNKTSYPETGQAKAWTWMYVTNTYRWKMNIKKWYQWRFKAWYRDNVKVRIGGLRKPMHTKEGDCPYCNEILYNPKRCLFCGQRLVDDLKVEDIGDIDFGHEESEENLFY